MATTIHRGNTGVLRRVTGRGGESGGIQRSADLVGGQDGKFLPGVAQGMEIIRKADPDAKRLLAFIPDEPQLFVTVSDDLVARGIAAGSLGSTELLLRCRDQYGTLPAVSAALGRRWSANANVFTTAVYDADANELQLVAGSDLRRVTGYQDFVDEAPLEADHLSRRCWPVLGFEVLAMAEERIQQAQARHGPQDRLQEVGRRPGQRHPDHVALGPAQPREGTVQVSADAIPPVPDPFDSSRCPLLSAVYEPHTAAANRSVPFRAAIFPLPT